VAAKVQTSLYGAIVFRKRTYWPRQHSASALLGGDARTNADTTLRLDWRWLVRRPPKPFPYQLLPKFTECLKRHAFLRRNLRVSIAAVNSTILACDSV
jgi:hypothetical protein